MKADAKTKPMTPERFVDDIVAKYAIDDRVELARVVRAAKRTYSSSLLSEDDARQLRNAIPKVTKVLIRDDNAARIASLLMDSDWSRIVGGPYNTVENGKIIARIWEARATFAAIDRMLQQPPRKNANIKLHGAVAVLRRFADENKVKGKINFIESVIAFINPAEAKKVRNVMSRRLKPLLQNREKKDGKLKQQE